MIDVTHYPDRGSWAFESRQAPAVRGGGSSRKKSIAMADHAVRQHLSRELGRSVDLSVARKHAQHLDRS